MTEEERDDALVRFLSMAGEQVDAEVGRSLLEASNWDVTTAFDMIVERPIGGTPPPPRTYDTPPDTPPVVERLVDPDWDSPMGHPAMGFRPEGLFPSAAGGPPRMPVPAPAEFEDDSPVAPEMGVPAPEVEGDPSMARILEESYRAQMPGYREQEEERMLREAMAASRDDHSRSPDDTGRPATPPDADMEGAMRSSERLAGARAQEEAALQWALRASRGEDAGPPPPEPTQPDPVEAPAPSRPTGAPAVQRRIEERRDLVQDQDAEYQESLLMDQMREQARREEEATLAEVRAAEERERRERNEAFEAKKRRVEEQEPGNDDPTRLRLVVRLPSGKRIMRNFRNTDAASLVYDWVEVTCPDEDFCSTRYSLVSQVPGGQRQELSEKTQTLKDHGVEHQSMFFVHRLE
mmetsp:Transcript_56495/g.121280  ORF Transcript_56495/g.121280 Transcript_56495/m.121280 type:complete len:407 (-) Transcript_56495:260-1480(-)